MAENNVIRVAILTAPEVPGGSEARLHYIRLVKEACQAVGAMTLVVTTTPRVEEVVEAVVGFGATVFISPRCTIGCLAHEFLSKSSELEVEMRGAVIELPPNGSPIPDCPQEVKIFALDRKHLVEKLTVWLRGQKS